MTPLLPLYVHPADDPASWHAAARLGRDATVVVNVDGGPGRRPDPAYADSIGRLAAAGVPLLGYVDLGHAARPLAEVLADVCGWGAYPVGGVFLDRAPADPFGAGPVALALRLARRAGLPAATLNPGEAADPLYRRLGARMCAFEGPWAEYVRWDGAGSRPGDGHLVYGVPPAEVPLAHRLAANRGAGFGLVTERTAGEAYRGLPAWCADPR
jgi:hypothetical protein